MGESEAVVGGTDWVGAGAVGEGVGEDVATGATQDAASRPAISRTSKGPTPVPEYLDAICRTPLAERQFVITTAVAS